MALTYGDYLIRGLSTDTKPTTHPNTAAPLLAGWRFRETDTQQEFKYNGSAWGMGYVGLANDTLPQAYGTNSVTKLTVTANRTLTTTVPAAGSQAITIILTSGTTSYTITFGAGFKPTGTLATGTVSARVFVVSWVSDGVALYECSRTIAMVA